MTKQLMLLSNDISSTYFLKLPSIIISDLMVDLGLPQVNEALGTGKDDRPGRRRQQTISLQHPHQELDLLSVGLRDKGREPSSDLDQIGTLQNIGAVNELTDFDLGLIAKDNLLSESLGQDLEAGSVVGYVGDDSRSSVQSEASDGSASPAIDLFQGELAVVLSNISELCAEQHRREGAALGFVVVFDRVEEEVFDEVGDECLLDKGWLNSRCHLGCVIL